MSELKEKINKQKEKIQKEINELEVEKRKAEEKLFKEHGFSSMEELEQKTEETYSRYMELLRLGDEDNLDSKARQIQNLKKELEAAENVNIDLRSEVGKLAFEFRKNINKIQKDKTEQESQEIDHTLLLFGIQALDYPTKFGAPPKDKEPYAEREFWYTSSFECERGYRLNMDEFDEIILDQTVGPKKPKNKASK